MRADWSSVWNPLLSPSTGDESLTGKWRETTSCRRRTMSDEVAGLVQVEARIDNLTTSTVTPVSWHHGCSFTQAAGTAVSCSEEPRLDTSRQVDNTHTDMGNGVRLELGFNIFQGLKKKRVPVKFVCIIWVNDVFQKWQRSTFCLMCYVSNHPFSILASSWTQGCGGLLEPFWPYFSCPLSKDKLHPLQVHRRAT